MVITNPISQSDQCFGVLLFKLYCIYLTRGILHCCLASFFVGNVVIWAICSRLQQHAIKLLHYHFFNNQWLNIFRFNLFDLIVFFAKTFLIAISQCSPTKNDFLGSEYKCSSEWKRLGNTACYRKDILNLYIIPL